jgi:hypothetical protein
VLSPRHEQITTHPVPGAKTVAAFRAACEIAKAYEAAVVEVVSIKESGAMKTFICWLTGPEDAVVDGELEQTREASVCCLVHAESVDQVDAPLRELLQRLPTSNYETLSDLQSLYLDQVFELPEEPRDAVLWYSSMSSSAGPDTLSGLHLELPVDSDVKTHVLPPDDPPDGGSVTLEPFIEFKQLPVRSPPKR